MFGKYLFWAFESRFIAYQFYRSATGITRYAISSDTISSSQFPLPPLTEQQSIVEYIQRKTKILDDLAQEITTSINLLKEKRISLISAAVTGQIDVSADL